MHVLFFLLLPTVLVISHQIGQHCGRFGLPAISGYLITGVFSGPWVFRLLSESGLLSIKVLDKLCLACVALSAGSEMHLQEIRKTFSAVGTIAMFITLSSWVFVCVAVMLFESQVSVPFAPPKHDSSRFACCSHLK